MVVLPPPVVAPASAPPAPEEEEDDDDDDEVLAASHMPMVLSLDEHVSPGGQPLPPEPRQPDWQVLVEVLHTRPAPPQSLSIAHPQVSLEAMHAEPGPVAKHALVCMAVHWTQWFVVVSQTGVEPEQSGLLRHCTQT
jgi:hypothetical protein